MKVIQQFKINCQVCLSKKAKVEKINKEEESTNEPSDTSTGLVRPFLVKELEVENSDDESETLIEIANPEGLEYWGVGVWKQNGIKYRIVVHLLDGEVPIELWEAMPQIGRTNLGRRGLSVEGTKKQQEESNEIGDEP